MELSIQRSYSGLTVQDRFLRLYLEKNKTWKAQMHSLVITEIIKHSFYLMCLLTAKILLPQASYCML